MMTLQSTTFDTVYDLLEERLNQLGRIKAKDAWTLCEGKVNRSYNTVYLIFTDIMETMIEQGKAEAIAGEHGVYNILKPNRA